MKLKISLLILFGLLVANYSIASTCLPDADAKLPQYIVGYGSLMNQKSAEYTDVSIGELIPVVVKGYKRGWYANFKAKDFFGVTTTFLGIIKDKSAEVNAVIFKLHTNEGLKDYDAREKNYCRSLVDLKNIKILNASVMPQGQVWAYVLPRKISLPSKERPIVQSYVDIFLVGCFDIEKTYNLPGFAKQCITNTAGWSDHWVNDRIYPRRPFIYQPKAFEIDALLAHELPALFKKIKIE